jgi:hypothetical protein
MFPFVIVEWHMPTDSTRSEGVIVGFSKSPSNDQTGPGGRVLKPWAHLQPGHQIA